MEHTLFFEDGSQTVWLNDEHTRFFKWFPNDLNFVDKLIRFEAKTNELIEKYRDLKGIGESLEDYKVGTIESIAEEFNKEFETVFNKGSAEHVFQGVNPFSPVAGGKLLFESFMEAATPLIEKSFEGFEESRQKYVDSLASRKVRRAK